MLFRQKQIVSSKKDLWQKHDICLTASPFVKHNALSLKTCSLLKQYYLLEKTLFAQLGNPPNLIAET